jgi:hypothetical protein
VETSAKSHALIRPGKMPRGITDRNTHGYA